MTSKALPQPVLLDAASTPSLLLDHCGRVVWANPATESLLRTGLGQLVGKQIYDFLDPADTLRSMLVQLAANPGQPIKCDVSLKVSLSSLTTLQAVLTGTEQAAWPVAVELINHADVLSVQAAEYRASQQSAQRELLRNLAHEIRNPLGGIRGAAQLLAREHKKLGGLISAEYTDVIVAESTRLQTLLDRLLSAQAAPKTMSLVNIHELCERVRSVLMAEFQTEFQAEFQAELQEENLAYPTHRPIHWQRDYDVSLPDIWVDDHQMVQVLLNLARNAAQILIEHQTAHAQITFKTRALRQLTLGAKRHKLALELLVIDNGPGIPEAIRPHLFSPLVTQRSGGTGLGLHIAHSFVQAHGGQIEVTSVPGLTQFRVLIPWLLGDFPQNQSAGS